MLALNVLFEWIKKKKKRSGCKSFGHPKEEWSREQRTSAKKKKNLLISKLKC